MPTLTAHRPNTPAWFDLMTSDAAAARDFYAQLFGWTFDVSGPELGYYAIASTPDGMAAGVGPLQPDAHFPPAWTVYFAVESAEDTVALAASHGAQVLVPPMLIPDRGVMAIVSDPTGAVLGLWQPGGHPGATIVHAPGAMTWCEVYTRDIPAAAAFYQAVFGLEAVSTGDPEMDYHLLRIAEHGMAGMLKIPAEWTQMPPHWMPYFAVGDVDTALARLASLGGQALKGPFDTPYGRMAMVSDPQGAVFAIIAPSYT